MGDFNDMLLSSDKFGGIAPSQLKIMEFKDCLDDCNLMDLGFEDLNLHGVIKEKMVVLFFRESILPSSTLSKEILFRNDSISSPSY